MTFVMQLPTVTFFCFCVIFLVSFVHLLKGYLDASIEAIDFDQENTINSTVRINVTKQEPPFPQIVAHQIDDRMARLKFKGCFDYSVRHEYLFNPN